MIREFLHDRMPRSLYVRAALILLLPVVTLQVVVSVAFVQRYYADVSRQMAQALVLDLRVVEEAARMGAAEAAASSLGMEASRGGSPPGEDHRDPWDLAGRAAVEEMRGEWPPFLAADLSSPRHVTIWADLEGGPLRLDIDRSRIAAENPHQLLVWTLASGAFLSAVAALFLRNQLRPIRRLARAASAYGRGQTIAFRPTGATELREAGTAFLEMRHRIERQAQARTAMLAGISHDLRTPLTRMRLQLSLMEGEDAEALARDVDDMARMVDAFLAFARGDAGDAQDQADVAGIARAVAEDFARSGGAVEWGGVEGEHPGDLTVRPLAIRRALENLIGNALAHGTRAVLSVAFGDRSVRLTVEDDGPGIPPARREEAVRPFVRLDAARNQDRVGAGAGMGAGVGLGLAIVADIARAHGGSLRLGESARLGGLRADLVIAR